jgi:hypothetical protein
MYPKFSVYISSSVSCAIGLVGSGIGSVGMVSVTAKPGGSSTSIPADGGTSEVCCGPAGRMAACGKATGRESVAVAGMASGIESCGGEPWYRFGRPSGGGGICMVALLVRAGGSSLWGVAGADESLRSGEPCRLVLRSCIRVKDESCSVWCLCILLLCEAFGTRWVSLRELGNRRAEGRKVRDGEVRGCVVVCDALPSGGAGVTWLACWHVYMSVANMQCALVCPVIRGVQLVYVELCWSPVKSTALLQG